jgi:hypothetical protein
MIYSAKVTLKDKEGREKKELISYKEGEKPEQTIKKCFFKDERKGIKVNDYKIINIEKLKPIGI